MAIKKPLFYNWELSLRFELEKTFTDSEEPTDAEHFEEIYKRAMTLFEYCFEAPETEIIIVIQKYSFNKSLIESDDYIFQQIKNFDPKKIERDQVIHLYEPDEDLDVWNRAFYQTTVSKVAVKNLVMGICNTEFPDRSPHIKEELYLINKTQQIIFHIYDDRGADVLMTDKFKLRQLYEKHSDWILEYDRNTMIERIS